MASITAAFANDIERWRQLSRFGVFKAMREPVPADGGLGRTNLPTGPCGVRPNAITRLCDPVDLPFRGNSQMVQVRIAQGYLEVKFHFE
jgi:hypothetical protein